MNKAESKYFNTAKLMNTAFLYLLEKKEYDKITVKEICEKAGVNRSTFYLHYETMEDLLLETIDNLNREFIDCFEDKPTIVDKKSSMFLTERYLIPYLNFVKKNKRVLKIIHSKPELFNSQNVFMKMYTRFFNPALKVFNVGEKEKPYVFEFFTKGVVAVVKKWIEKECEDSVDFITQLIINFVGCRV
ncbi:MAG: TetR/AcrR family transcriptional regulator C-terminal domain-containing protein [Clostridia bacterium]|nr:TetR/AcrR family transcriptional regulator C-terminal domain-containing protein [Clostridia bacterium]